MKNVKFKKMEHDLKIISASLFAGTIMVSTMAGCTKESPVNSDESVSLVPTVTLSVESDISSSSTNSETVATTETTVSLDSYAFPWEDDENYEFDNYITQKYGISLSTYAFWFGYTDELNADLTRFVNDRFKTDYESVSFKKANYFYTYIKIAEVRDFYAEYDYFEVGFLNENKLTKGAFNNKLVMSYLAQNNIPFGYRVPIENMKALVGDSVYTCYLEDEIYSDKKFGNYEDSHSYTNEELVTAIKAYNTHIATLAIDQGIKTLDLEGHLDVCEKYNDNLRKFFGDDAPQFGQCLTTEQVTKLKGGYYDLSYIDGAIYKGNTQVKGDARVRYGDSIDEYTMSYLPGYEYYTEEVESQGRSR